MEGRWGAGEWGTGPGPTRGGGWPPGHREGGARGGRGRGGWGGGTGGTGRRQDRSAGVGADSGEEYLVAARRAQRAGSGRGRARGSLGARRPRADPAAGPADHAQVQRSWTSAERSFRLGRGAEPSAPEPGGGTRVTGALSSGGRRGAPGAANWRCSAAPPPATLLRDCWRLTCDPRLTPRPFPQSSSSGQ